MKEYLNLVKNVLKEGNRKENRTAVDTISTFNQSYEIDLAGGFPLLTTKKMDGFRWNSLIYELIWYFSGDHHIRNLREETKIWDDWADEDWNLPTAYGRFWRRYPLPSEESQLEGEWWPIKGQEWISHASEYYDVSESDIEEGIERWVTKEDGYKVFDQLQYVIDTLNGEHPYRGPESRRIIVNAWHPANAAVSKLPPCHYTFVFNIQDDELHLHLTQRSADIALGVPFNIAAYTLLLKIIAQRTGFKPGKFGHTLVDAHIYCGKSERGEWYENNLEDLARKINNAVNKDDYKKIREWLIKSVPPEENKGYDHVPNLLKQISREPLERPEIKIANKPIGELDFGDIELKDYDSHEGLSFEVAE